MPASSPPESEPSRKVHADPTKDFFVSMITRDITLEDCIVDLLDNCIDGARATIRRKGREDWDSEVRPYEGFQAKLTFSKDSFELVDNCGGMSLNDATEYAFRFGRRSDTDPAQGGIGLYGIGLKRAVFKMGREIMILSKQEDNQFLVPINVEAWQKEDSWDFNLEPYESLDEDGTTIKVKELHPEIANSFDDRVFKTHLYRTIARDYSFILQKGFKVSINGEEVNPFSFQVVEQGNFLPERRVYSINGVNVTITAGMTDPPPDDLGPNQEAARRNEYYGWFVTCNDRIVLAANKNDRTIWGRDDFPAWHSQYNGFMGIVTFKADDPRRLPWTTTKREIDIDASIYKDAVAKMKAATRPYISYTNARKENLEEAREVESAAFQQGIRPIDQISIREASSYPTLSKPAQNLTNVQYRVPKKLLTQVATSLGDKTLAATKIGRSTFDYYVERELGPAALEE